MRFAVLGFCLLLPVAAMAAPQKAPLDRLFDALHQAQNPEDAKPIEDKIFAAFARSGSASVDLLMARGSAALAAGDNATARRLFDAVTAIAPTYAEGWRNRAELQLAAGDDEGAMVSLQKAITLNPRQFAAMEQLAGMLEDYGDKRGALKLYRRVQALDPQYEGVARHVRALTRAVEGQGI